MILLKTFLELEEILKKIIIIDNEEHNFKLNKSNGIKIAPFYGRNSKSDTVLYELKKILILIYKQNYNDLRTALKDYSYDIKNKITLG